MSDGNLPIDAMPQVDVTELMRTIAELKAKVAQFEESNVYRPNFVGQCPKYKLNAPVYLEDDVYHEEGEEIEYLGTPNMDMVPLNDAATTKMREYMDYLTKGARDAAEANGRQFRGLITDQGVMIATSMQDARRAAGNTALTIPTEKSEIPVMPHTDEAKAQAKRSGRVKDAKVVSAKAPPPPPRPTPEPASIMGSRYTGEATRSVG